MFRYIQVILLVRELCCVRADINNKSRCLYGIIITADLLIVTISGLCPGYLEWWLDSNLHLVLFTQYILKTVSVRTLYMRGGQVVNSSERWLIHAEWWLFLISVGTTLYIYIYIYNYTYICVHSISF